MNSDSTANWLISGWITETVAAAAASSVINPCRAIQNGWNMLGLKLPRRTIATPLISASIRNAIAETPAQTFALSIGARKRASLVY
jgi:hypothetical protein